jgi:signal peptidase
MNRHVLRGWVATVCAGWLMAIWTLALFSLGPMFAGWQPVVVSSGSMEPALEPGDVAIVDPAGRGPAVGRIVVVRHADAEGGLLIHRVSAVRADGALLTKGDANARADLAATRPGDVVGVVRFVVPSAGWLPLLLRHPAPRPAAWAVLTLLAVAGIRPPHRARPRHRAPTRQH